jgi:hypothetical protein
MSNLRTAFGSCAVALAAVALSPTAAVAEERTCRGTIGSRTLDNVRVPQDATCVLEGTRVQGTVKVETNAILRARDVRVIGNVQGENARRVAVVQGSRVGGAVQVVQGRSANVADSRINGDILYDENRRALRAVDNWIGGSLQAFQNTGGVTIRNNTIEGNLQCKQNNPPPVGGGNVVDGNKEDQCARL